MARLTIKQRVIRYLEAQGFTLSPIQPSNRYTTYSKHITASTGETRVAMYHVGKAGGVRVGTKGITKSFSATDHIHKFMKEWEHSVLLRCGGVE